MAYSKDHLKSFCRYEISGEELMDSQKYTSPFEPCPDPEKYGYVCTLADLSEAIENGSGEEEEFIRQWVPLFLLLVRNRHVLIENTYEGDNKGMPTEYSILLEAAVILAEMYGSEETDADLDEVRDLIKNYYDNLKRPLDERTLTVPEMMDFILYWRSGDEQPEGIRRRLYQEYVDLLADNHMYEALHIRAEECSEGTHVFAPDWKQARADYEELLDMTNEPQYAEALGNIAYYGRTNDGRPEYDRALQYYTMAAMTGRNASRLKLADMYLYGEGVRKNPISAASAVNDVYSQELELFVNEEYDCLFADSAYHMGNLYRDAEEIYEPDMAYYYYLQAQYALLKKMEVHETFEDRNLALKIAAAIREVLPDTEYAEKHYTVHYQSIEDILMCLEGTSYQMEMDRKILKSGKVQLVFRYHGAEYDDVPPKLLMTVPEAGYCCLTDRITVHMDDAGNVPTAYDRDTVYFDYMYNNSLYQGEDRVASFFDEMTLKIKKPKEEKKESVQPRTYRIHLN